MRRFCTLYIIIFWVLNSFAQEFGTHWISCPAANDSSQVLFYGSYDWEAVPQRAFLSFASTGMVKVYANERNVSGDIFFANGNAGMVEVHTFDVTRYLKQGTNSFAVWYAPVVICQWASNCLCSCMVQAWTENLSLRWQTRHGDAACRTVVFPMRAAQRWTALPRHSVMLSLTVSGNLKIMTIPSGSLLVYGTVEKGGT